MSGISFSSILKSEYYNDLESLLYFNPQQGKVRSELIESIEKYGNPKILIDNNLLRISIEALSDVQTLFAFESLGRDANLIGIIVYVRYDRKNILILHIAVKDDYSISGSLGDEMLVMKLIIKVRDIARRIKGVHSMNLMYAKGTIKKIPL